MSAMQTATAVALYFDVAGLKAVPLKWVERAQMLFVEHGLSPVLFTASGGCFELDDCYVLAENEGVRLWNQWLSACRGELMHELRNGTISSAHLDSPRDAAQDRDDSRLMVSLSSTIGMFYAGIDDDLIPSPAVWLRRAWQLADSLLPVRYGIAYKRALSEHPQSYAAGQRSFSAIEAFDLIRGHGGSTQKIKNEVERWGEELAGRKRHLRGMFRDAFPASLVSDLHVQRARLNTCGIGTLSALGASLWLWELSDEEIPMARSRLEQTGAVLGAER